MGNIITGAYVTGYLTYVGAVCNCTHPTLIYLFGAIGLLTDALISHEQICSTKCLLAKKPTFGYFYPLAIFADFFLRNAAHVQFQLCHLVL
uniref:Uncharacterized protein n=1 Tax=Ditylenchus dipsaci TaxID=166011 RepID=A0A915D1B8_9BILA